MTDFDSLFLNNYPTEFINVHIYKIIQEMRVSNDSQQLDQNQLFLFHIMVIFQKILKDYMINLN